MYFSVLIKAYLLYAFFDNMCLNTNKNEKLKNKVKD